MAKVKAKPLARRWKVGQRYELHGKTGKRTLEFIGRGRLNGRELLMFHPAKAASKNKP
jgi:hypothetical protein